MYLYILYLNFSSPILVYIMASLCPFRNSQCYSWQKKECACTVLALASPALPGQSLWKQGFRKAPYSSTRAPDAYNHRMCTLNVYGSDAVVWGRLGEYEKNAGEKQELICITHRHALLYRYRCELTTWESVLPTKHFFCRSMICYDCLYANMYTL